MRSLFYNIHRTVMKAVERSGYSVSRILSMLGISRSWYYSQISFSPIIDGRFNPMAIRNDDEWLVIGFKHRYPKMSFREIAYTLIDEDLAYLSPFCGLQYTEEARSDNAMEASCMGIHKA